MRDALHLDPTYEGAEEAHHAQELHPAQVLHRVLLTHVGHGVQAGTDEHQTVSQQNVCSCADRQTDRQRDRERERGGER